MNDLISRQAAIDALGERPVVWSDNDDYTLGERNQYDMNRLAIETVPSAQPERKTGKWIKENIVPTSNPPQYMWHCSVCGKLMYWFNDSVLTSFCPNCGAEMEANDGEIH